MDNTTFDLVFPAVGGREVVSRNDGGDITSDAGLLLVSLADKKLGLRCAMASAITDHRDPDKVVHGIIEMARERIYAICLPYRSFFWEVAQLILEDCLCVIIALVLAVCALA